MFNFFSYLPMLFFSQKTILIFHKINIQNLDQRYIKDK